MISDVTRTHEWRTARMAAKIHQTAHGEGNDARRFEIPIWAGKTEACDGGHNESGIDNAQRFITQSDAVETADRCIFHQHVGATREVTDGFPSLFGLKIQNYAALVGMVRGKRNASFGMLHVVPERPFTPHRITSRWLDKNHLCAKIGKQQPAVAAHAPGQIKNT